MVKEVYCLVCDLAVRLAQKGQQYRVAAFWSLSLERLVSVAAAEVRQMLQPVVVYSSEKQALWKQLEENDDATLERH